LGLWAMGGGGGGIHYITHDQDNNSLKMKTF
jgi:hypothetical protein